MTTWTERMHRRAATFSNVVTSCGHPNAHPYPKRLEKVKFGIPLEEVCKNDIPAPLLVLILKLNKEAPMRKDVFRAPGHQGAMKKLTHFLETGRLVNMDNFSVYTIASVLKKFLRKLPGGVFGHDCEVRLFEIIEIEDVVDQRNKIHGLITSLPIHTQRLLVLLFGTFRVIATNSDRAATGMSSEALGVSVAPSFFQSCVSDGKTARMEDVLRFKMATRIMKHLIDEFSSADLFGRDNYEWYARVTGRILRVQGQWICSFTLPAELPHLLYSKKISLEPGKTWLQCQCDRWNGTGYSIDQPDESQSLPTLIQTSPTQPTNSATSLGIVPEHTTLFESCTRLSVSLEENGLFKVEVGSASRSSSQSSRNSHSGPRMTLDELRAVNRYAESTKSLTYLPQVHERQTARMLTRSEWFLTPLQVECSGCGGSVALTQNQQHSSAQQMCVAAVTAAAVAVCQNSNFLMDTNSSSNQTLIHNALKHSSSDIIDCTNLVLSTSSDSLHQKRSSIKRNNSRDKRYYYHDKRFGNHRTDLVHRSNSRRSNKENNGTTTSSRSNSFRNKSQSVDSTASTLQRSNSYKSASSSANVTRTNSFKSGSSNNKNSKICVCRTNSKKNRTSASSAAILIATATNGQQQSSIVDPMLKNSSDNITNESNDLINQSDHQSGQILSHETTPMEIQTIQVTVTYKPRI